VSFALDPICLFCGHFRIPAPDHAEYQRRRKELQEKTGEPASYLRRGQYGVPQIVP